MRPRFRPGRPRASRRPTVGLAPAGTALAFEHVGMTFPDGSEVLRDLSLTVGTHDIVALVGASGSGKSTLLRIAAGLTPPTSGTVSAGPGSPALIFQDPTLLPWRTVAGNVGLFAELDGVPRAQRAGLVADALALTGLSDYERHRPRALSGGMRMRVSLARALTARPALFLLDEPFGALDEITRQRLGDELVRLHLREGFAGLFVTHSVVEAVALARRVGVLSARSGRLVAEVEIPFDYPRTETLRYDAAFGRVARTVSEALKDSFSDHHPNTPGAPGTPSHPNTPDHPGAPGPPGAEHQPGSAGPAGIDDLAGVE
ncbi:sulfate ABC transporter ATP-binding protein [Frankia sp. CcI49]|uniref:ATP-binding cassette domain-containing protein n=1 Tax=Frankia sp. CcI49 TaxID=1745382 RepID=UPI000975DBC3|nr:ATP-binding cassette domain-containing protein [Frankia sp. CcI49]ONH49719.1 sulfate ABC transporter ATP-binding protein [Frankia sp. CcI49]